MERNLSDQEQQRRAALEQIRELNIDPYPPETYETNTSAAAVKARFDQDNPEALQNLRLAGRLMGRRVMGKASFAELEDESGTIQLYASRERIKPTTISSLRSCWTLGISSG